MATSEWTVYIVDDDVSVRDALAMLLGAHGYRTMIFGDAEGLQRAYSRDLRRTCVLIDIRMPGMDGLALQQWLLQAGSALPVIIMTGHGNVEAAREAFRAHAVDFLEKPINHQRLLAAIEEAIAQRTESQALAERNAAFVERLQSLTPREREVMELVVAGRHNREIADLLSISPRTVEVHKTRVMQKLKADSIAKLVRLSLGAADDASGAAVPAQDAQSVPPHKPRHRTE